MSLLDETVEVPRRTMTLFFLVDTSGSMDGRKIGAVNESIQEVLPMIRDISANNPDAEINVAALQFSTGTSWVYDEPKAADDFIWQDASADGLTCLGEACEELCGKLSKNGFMKSASGSYAPAIILLSDGEPTDDFDSGLSKLEENKWFKHAIHNIDALKKMIRIVVVTSSQVGSQSSAAGESTKQQQVIEQVQDAQKEELSSGGSSSGFGDEDDWD